MFYPRRLSTIAALVASVVLCGAAGLNPALAQCELDKLLASDGAAYAAFGSCVASFDGTMVIGAPSDGLTGPYMEDGPGAVYVFRLLRSGCLQEQKLLASDQAGGDAFGFAVGIYDNTMVIGAPRDDDNGRDSGSAYVFQLDGPDWVQKAKLRASDGGEFDIFGESVGIYGDTIVVGARWHDGPGPNSGAAYLFQVPGGGWADMTETAKLTSSDAAQNAEFGSSVRIWADTVVIGARGDDDNGSYAGAAYVFQKPMAGWADMTETAKLTASDGATQDTFGWAVAIWEDTIVVGAYRDDDNGENSGSAYAFEKPGGGWVNMTETAKLTASDGEAEDSFGYSVAILGNRIIIGTPYSDEGLGSACAFHKNDSEWIEHARLLTADGEAGDRFGTAVATVGDYAIIGSYADNDNGEFSGSAYVFGLTEGACRGGCGNGVGCGNLGLFWLLSLAGLFMLKTTSRKSHG